MKKQYSCNGHKFLISNDYDWIVRHINYHMDGVRIPCKYCTNSYVMIRIKIISKNKL